MARKGENIRKRQDGRWEARYKKGRDQNGHIRYGYLYARTYREVKEKKREMLIHMIREQDTGRKPAVSRECLTIRTAGELWLEETRTRVKDTTYSNYYLILKNHIFPDFGDVVIRRLDNALIAEYAAQLLQKGKKPGTVKVILGILKNILRFAEQHHCFPEETLHFPKIASPKSQPRVMPLSDYRKLSGYLEQSQKPFEFGILLCMYTGIRIGELCGLRWEDFDFDSGNLTINRTVTRIENPEYLPGASGQRTRLLIGTPKSVSSIRQIPLPDLIIQKAIDYRREDGIYLLTGTQKCMEPRTVQRRYQRLLKRCDITPVNIHAMRHQLSSRWIEYGFDIKALSEILGHASTRTTLDIYVHCNNTKKRSYLNQVMDLK